MDEIETRVAVSTAAQLERHNLKQAHERLHAARVSIGNLRSFDLPAGAEDELRALQAHIEDVEWRIEQRILALGKAQP